MANAASAKSLPVDARPLGVPNTRDLVSVLPALRSVVPGGGLRPGSIVGLDGLGAASLGLALVAGVGEAGGWCGIVGVPDFGVVAALGMGAAPERLLLVDEPGDRWPDVLAALIEAVDLILVRTPEAPPATAVRRLSALARKHGCVLALTGAFAGDWPGTRLRLRMDDASWEGLGDGHGVLRGRRARITAEGRDAPGRGRQAVLWLPGPDGQVAPDDTAPRRPALGVVTGNGVSRGRRSEEDDAGRGRTRKEGGHRRPLSTGGATGFGEDAGSFELHGSRPGRHEAAPQSETADRRHEGPADRRHEVPADRRHEVPDGRLGELRGTPWSGVSGGDVAWGPRVARGAAAGGPERAGTAEGRA